jgi:hypothetical protein
VACCAFAAFLLMQLLAPFAWLRDRLFGPRAVAVSASVAWSPSAVAEAAPARRFGWRRGLFAVAVLELALLAGGYQYLQSDAPSGDTMTLAEALHASWCGTGPLADSGGLAGQRSASSSGALSGLSPELSPGSPLGLAPVSSTGPLL